MVLPLEWYQRELEAADAAFARGDRKTATTRYAAVISALEEAIATSQRAMTGWCLVIGGLLGAFVPVVPLLTIPLGAYAGYRLSRNAVAEHLLSTAYGDCYRRALHGLLACRGNCPSR